MPDLERLLDDARSALLAGDLARLAPVSDAMGASPPPQGKAALMRVIAKAQRNAQLLEAAMKGVRAARRRLAEVSHRDRFVTYDAQGRRDEVAAGNPLPARRL